MSHTRYGRSNAAIACADLPSSHRWNGLIWFLVWSVFFSLYLNVFILLQMLPKTNTGALGCPHSSPSPAALSAPAPTAIPQLFDEGECHNTLGANQTRRQAEQTAQRSCARVCVKINHSTFLLPGFRLPAAERTQRTGGCPALLGPRPHPEPQHPRSRCSLHVRPSRSQAGRARLPALHHGSPTAEVLLKASRCPTRTAQSAQAGPQAQHRAQQVPQGWQHQWPALSDAGTQAPSLVPRSKRSPVAQTCCSPQLSRGRSEYLNSCIFTDHKGGKRIT